MSTSVDIRALRKRLNWTQERLADHLGVDRSSVSRMEKGQPIRRPVAKLLAKLASRSTAKPQSQGAAA